ncbi:MAG: hypothetical protein KKF27_20060 [Gammaproteobacteria bacterium]|nr:hypothetical protein [Gammaproteobacteria bacterium]
METYEVRIVFTEPLLGTVALEEELFSEFVKNKGIDNDDELETLPVAEQIEKGTTGFHRVDGQPILYDYVLKGFFKDACGMLRRVPKTESSKCKAYKKIIDGLVFVTPRRIPIELSGELTFLERPLRAQTAQGERIALARSEQAPAGSSIVFTMTALGQVDEKLLTEWLDYGSLRGLGQWRNAGWGRFQYALTKR